MPQKPVYSARNSAEATIVMTLLQDEGVNAIMTNHSLQGALGELPLGSSTSPQVIVDEPDFDRAREIVKAYEADLAHPDASQISDEIGQFDWPLCPDCDEMREMTCPRCKYSGPEFQLQLDYLAEDLGLSGDQGDRGADAQTSIPVVCGRCEAASLIAFDSMCRYCQHDFAKSDQLTESFPESMESINSSRTIVVFMGLLLVVVILVLWAVFAR